MIGATALHTRAACDNCGEMPATREGPGGTVLCDGCGTVKPANDDAQGAFCARPICARCLEPAFVRLKDGDLCSACFTISNSVASPPQNAKVTVAAPSALPQVTAAVTTFSKPPEALALLFCAPFRRSSDITNGDRPGTEAPALFDSLEILDLASVLSGTPGACSSEREDVGASNSKSRACEGDGSNADGSKTSDGSARYSSGDGLGIQQPGSNEQGRARDRAKCPAVSGNSSCDAPCGAPCDARPCRDGGVSVTPTSSPDESNPDSASAPPPSTADASSKLATLRRDAVFSSAGSVEQATRDNLAGPMPLLRSSEILGSGANFDPELDRLVSALEARGFAPSDDNSNSVSVGT
jgi:hypothetical protein